MPAERLLHSVHVHILKRFSTLVALLVLSMAAISFPALAADTYTTEVTNQIFMGDIRISLEELSGDGGTASALVLPGQRVEKTLRIHNEANSAWVRAKLEYPDCGAFRGLSDDDIELASDRWVKRGAYYYYTEPVEKQQYVELLKAVHIPASWDSGRSGESFVVNTTVDAVQSAHFTPDFTSEDPWFGTVIEACVHTGDSAALETAEPFSVTFEGGADGIVRVGDDFFSHWGALMPGDTVSDTVTVGNAYVRPTYVYFRTESTMDDALLRQLRLTIRNGDTVLYDGTMDGTIEHNVTLGCFSKGKSGKLSYTVQVPASLDNSYGLSNSRTKWIFSCTSVRSAGGGGGGTGGSSSGTGSNGSSSSSTKGPAGQLETSGATESSAAIAESGAATDTAGRADADGSDPGLDKRTAGRNRYPDGDGSTDDSRSGKKRKDPKTGDTSQAAAYLVSAVLLGLAAAGIILMGRRQERCSGQEHEKHSTGSR